MKVDAINKDAR